VKVYIKNMDSLRCKKQVAEELSKLGIDYSSLELGRVRLNREFTGKKKEILNGRLNRFGLEIIDDKKQILAERISHMIKGGIYDLHTGREANYAEYLSEKAGHDYNYLSQVFCEVKGVAIEDFIASQKVAAVKELLMYDELTIDEIAKELNYSSTAHLKRQFRDIAGITPEYYKLMELRRA